MARVPAELSPEVLRGRIIAVSSDYGGEHASSEFDVYSLLFVDIQLCREYELVRREVRRRFLKDNRRMSYKGLNDRRKQRALLPFLAASSHIPGFLVSIAVDKHVRTLFSTEDDPPEDDIAEVLQVPPGIVEKLLRVIHFTSFFLAGISSEGQDVIWFTDEDAIVANPKRAELFTKISRNALSHYLPHKLNSLSIGTTKTLGGSDLLAEDLSSVPDFAAGAFADLAPHIVAVATPAIIAPIIDFQKYKANLIASWLSETNRPLKTLNIVITQRPGWPEKTVIPFRFHDLSLP